MFNYLGQGQVSLKDVENSIKELPLPQKIKAISIFKRYKEIKKIQDQMKEAIKQVEKKYLKLDTPVLQGISNLVKGSKGIQEAQLKDLEKYLSEEERAQVKDHLEPRKLAGYWSKVLNASGMIKESIGKDDYPLLQKLQNIFVVDEEGTDNFTIHFEFADNQFIANKELTKKFFIKKDAPVRTDGTKIEWKTKNLTVKQVKKKQKNKKTGQQRVVTKTVQAKSFFNFFRSIQEIDQSVNPLELNEQQLQQREKIEHDFEIGGVLVDEVLPYSLEYYLGIEHDEDDYGDDLEEEDEQDQGSDDEDKKKKSKSKGKNKKPQTATTGKTQEKPECKNQ